jgi:hypothetical protein
MGMMLDEQIRALGVDVSNDVDGDPAGTMLLSSTPSHLLKYREGQRLVLLSMWEADNLPEPFRENLHLFDTVLVPSQQNVDLFGEFHPNVRYVPLGIDPKVWKPTRRTKPGHRFNFLIGGSGPRKGLDLAYKAFRTAFPDRSWGDGPEPWLVFKSPRNVPFSGQRISQINGRISGEEEVLLYAQSHCYLQPSRGEGFGLQPLQAIAQGCPTILTAAHGHASFAHLGIGLSSTMTETKPGSFMHGEAGMWWEPDLNELIEQMRWVYDNYDQAESKAWDCGRIAFDEFTWENSAKRVLDILGSLEPYSGSGEWMEPVSKKYKVVLNRAHAADVAGYSYRWEPWTEYVVSADLKRLLFDAGFLDPSCIFGDQGLTVEEIERAGLKSGAESFCPTCNQVLNSMPSKADRAEAGVL